MTTVFLVLCIGFAIVGLLAVYSVLKVGKELNLLKTDLKTIKSGITSYKEFAASIDASVLEFLETLKGQFKDLPKSLIEECLEKYTKTLNVLIEDLKVKLDQNKDVSAEVYAQLSQDLELKIDDLLNMLKGGNPCKCDEVCEQEEGCACNRDVNLTTLLSSIIAVNNNMMVLFENHDPKMMKKLNKQQEEAYKKLQEELATGIVDNDSAPIETDAQNANEVLKEGSNTSDEIEKTEI